MGSPQLDLATVEARVAKGEPLVVFDGGVYSLEPLLHSHPGGTAVLEESLGKDISDTFRGIGEHGYHEHSRSAMRLMAQMQVGRLFTDAELSVTPTPAASDSGSGTGAEAGAREGSFQLDRSKGVVLQVGHLRGSYNEWVHQPDMSPEEMRFFESPFLEFFSGTPWWLIPLLWLPLALAALGHAFWVQETRAADMAALVTAGLVVWAFLEYLLHRFLFHFVPTSYWSITVHFLLHGCHHKRPMDNQRLVFPPVLASPLVLANAMAMLKLLPRPAAFCVFGGALIGYVSYDMVHYYLHHASVTRGSYMGYLKSTHLAHHFKDHNVSFGITSPVLDFVFSTLPRRETGSTAKKGN